MKIITATLAKTGKVLVPNTDHYRMSVQLDDGRVLETSSILERDEYQTQALARMLRGMAVELERL